MLYINLFLAILTWYFSPSGVRCPSSSPRRALCYSFRLPAAEPSTPKNSLFVRLPRPSGLRRTTHWVTVSKVSKRNKLIILYFCLEASTIICMLDLKKFYSNIRLRLFRWIFNYWTYICNIHNNALFLTVIIRCGYMKKLDDFLVWN